jgi:hypothetical protein
MEETKIQTIYETRKKALTETKDKGDDVGQVCGKRVFINGNARPSLCDLSQPPCLPAPLPVAFQV